MLVITVESDHGENGTRFTPLPQIMGPTIHTVSRWSVLILFQLFLINERQ